MTRNSRIAGLCAALGATLAAAPAHADDYLQLGLGVDYSSGDYGAATDSDILAIPFSVKYKQGGFTLRASLPYLHVKGPAIPGDGGAITGTGIATSRDGIGDLTVGAAYSIPLTETTFFDLSGRVKLPTASETKSLGTGTTDVTAEAELVQVFGPASVSLRGGRRFNGSNALFPLQDVWQAGGGIYYTAGKLTLGLDYDWRDAALPTSFDRSELSGSVSYSLSPAVSLQGYGYTGFTNGSPDLGGGLQLLYRFGR